MANEVFEKYGFEVDYKIGTMIEVPRAAIIADKIARIAEFFSFGTNDLTQTTLGISRDDAGRFLPLYVESPFRPVCPQSPTYLQGRSHLQAVYTAVVSKT